MLLRRLPFTQDQISQRVGVSEMSVNNWATGRKVPSSAARDKLLAEFEIPTGTWDDEPSLAGLDEDDPDEDVEGFDFDAALAILKRSARRLMKRVMSDPQSTTDEQVKVLRNLHGLLREIGKDTGQFELGPRLFKLPIWARVEEAFGRALRGHPEQLAALREEFRRMAETATAGRPAPHEEKRS